MKLSEKGVKFIAEREGVILKPYLDSVKVATIGIGSTMWEDGRRVSMQDKPITLQRAYELFHHTVTKYEYQVNESVKSKLTQNQFDALVSLCYNIGCKAFSNSTVALKANANPNDPSISDAFKMWRNAGGRPILLKRRIAEAELYFS